MIVDEHITSYLHSLRPDLSPLLEELRAYAAENDVPIIRREVESLIEVLAEMIRAERILEIGTGIAFSAIFMAEHIRSAKEILTIENYLPRIELSRRNIKRFESEGNAPSKIRLIEADAAEALKDLSGPFDLIFLDGPKAQYPLMLPDLLGLLRNGGILIADNVLQDGDLVRSRYLLPRRERTIHERMRDYLYTLTHDPYLKTTILPIGDGVAVSLKIG